MTCNLIRPWWVNEYEPPGVYSLNPHPRLDLQTQSQAPQKRRRIRAAPKPTRRLPSKLTATLAEHLIARQMARVERERLETNP